MEQHNENSFQLLFKTKGLHLISSWGMHQLTLLKSLLRNKPSEVIEVMQKCLEFHLLWLYQTWGLSNSINLTRCLPLFHKKEFIREKKIYQYVMLTINHKDFHPENFPLSVEPNKGFSFLTVPNQWRDDFFQQS